MTFERVGICALIIAAGLAGSALAQDLAIPVSYTYKKTYITDPMNAAIDEALSGDGFTRQESPDAKAIVLSVPGGWRYTEFRNKDHIQFTLAFFQGGEKIGQADEVCPAKPPYDCVQQIASDVKSAAAIAAR